MKRLRQWLFNGLIVLSAICGLQVRSHWIQERIEKGARISKEDNALRWLPRWLFNGVTAWSALSCWLLIYWTYQPQPPLPLGSIFDWDTKVTGFGITLPKPAFVALTLFLPLVWIALQVARAFRGRRLSRPGHCPCDYDLTGNVSGVCPECGKAVNEGTAAEGRRE